MNTDLIKSIQSMIPKGKRLELPETQISNYTQVKKILTKAA